VTLWSFASVGFPFVLIQMTVPVSDYMLNIVFSFKEKKLGVVLSVPNPSYSGGGRISCLRLAQAKLLLPPRKKARDVT
jgi:hypothetical protein